jgi:hypothetical protein
MFKITLKETNKLVSFTDKFFSYDWRIMKRENSSESFDFLAVNKDYNRTITVSISRTNSKTLYLSIREREKKIYTSFVKSYQDINIFKQMIRCLG